MLVQLFTSPAGLASLGVILFMVGMGVFFIHKALKSSWDDSRK